MPELSAVQEGFWGGREPRIEDREKNRSEPEGDGRQRSENYEDIEPRSLSQKSRNGSEKKMEGDALHVPGEVKKNRVDAGALEGLGEAETAAARLRAQR